MNFLSIDIALQPNLQIKGMYKQMPGYFESFQKSKHIRDEQYKQLETYLAEKIEIAGEKRKHGFRPDFTTAEKYLKSICLYRERIKEIIGYPPPHTPVGPDCKEEFVGEDELCAIYRLFIKVAEGLTCYGIYMLPKDKNGKVPLALALHGAGGCPEMICNFDGMGNYNDASRKLVKQGYAVFSPLFSFRSYADADETEIPKNMRAILDKKAKWLGTSLAAIETFKLISALDYLIQKEEIDSNRIIAAGLSFGGFYALLISAIDERVKCCISSCYFNDRVLIEEKHYDDFYDWIWKGSLTGFTDVELVALICPRLCIIEVGKNDELFPVGGARKVIDDARHFYTGLGMDENLKYYEFDGGHEFNLGFLSELKI